MAASKPLSHEAHPDPPPVPPFEEASPWLAKSRYGTSPVPPAPSSETPLDKMVPSAQRKSLVDEAEGVSVVASAAAGLIL